jgi:hypothetical protein
VINRFSELLSPISPAAEQEVRNQFCLGACCHCGLEGFMRCHGYLKGFDKQGIPDARGWRFFAPISIVTAAVDERFQLILMI